MPRLQLFQGRFAQVVDTAREPVVVSTVRRVRMIVCDLDGVLLLPSGELGPVGVAAMRQCQRAGVLVTWATSREPWSVARIAAPHDLSGWAATALGAARVDLSSGMLLAQHPLSSEHLELLSDLRQSRPEVRFGWTNAHRRYVEPGYPTSDLRAVVASSLWQESGEHPILMVSLRSPLASDLAHPGSRVVGLLEWHSWADGPADVTASGRTKLRAVQEMAADAGVSHEQVVAFGDTAVDLEMMAWAGYSVAPRTAEPEVRAVADELVDDCASEGVARWLLAQ